MASIQQQNLYTSLDFSILQKPVWLIWSRPKKYLSVPIFGRLESFREQRLPHPKVLAMLKV